MDIKITTLSIEPAMVQVETAAGATIQIISTGKVVASGVGPVCQLQVPKCLLWSDATPKLYTCRVSAGAQVTEKKFGICQYAWEKGNLLVNGRTNQLRPIRFDGAAQYSTQEIWRQVLIFKDGYFNAVACQKAPQALIDACDYYGVYLLTDDTQGNEACLVAGGDLRKLGCVDGTAVDSTGCLQSPCAYATTRWEMELEVRFGVRPAGNSAALTESWAWHGCQGQKMDVEVYALAPSVELKLNGKSLGKKKTTDCKAVYKVNYAPGKLEAAAFNGSGTRIAGGKLESAAGETRLRLQVEEATPVQGEVAFVAVTLEGENGVVVCGMDRALSASVTGGELLKLTQQTENGRGLAVVRREENTVLTVTDGQQTTSIAL